MCSVTFKFTKVALALILLITFISLGRCQEDDEDDEEYEEDHVDEATTKKYRLKTTTTTTPAPEDDETAPPAKNGTTSDATTKSPEKAASSNSSSTSDSGGAAAVAAAPAPTPAPTTRRAVTYPTPQTRGTTLADSEEEVETTTEEEGLGYVFRPLNSLIDNIVAGNVSGIVDHALSIRAPPEVREFVNHVMSNVFGVGIGSALRQFMPSLFTTVTPPIAGRDPIPGQEVQSSQVAAPAPASNPTQIAIPLQAIIEARANASEDGKQSKTKQGPLQIKLAHPGAPASRLRCEVIAE